MSKIIRQKQKMETETIEKNGGVRKRHNKRGKFFMLCVLLFAFLCLGNEAVGQTWDIGNPGYNSNVKATLSGGTLTISGNGDISSRNFPWEDISLAITKVIIGGEITTVPNLAFNDCINLTDVVFIDGQTILTLGNQTGDIYPGSYAVFRNCPINNLYIGRNINYLTGWGSSTTFQNNNTILTSLVFGNNITSIGNSAFSGCTSLNTVTIGNKIKTIDERCFQNCKNLQTLIMDGTVLTSIGNYAFDGCSSLDVFTIPQGVNTIGNYAFNGCSSLDVFTIPQGVNTIGNYAFNDCVVLSTVTIGANVETIGASAFNQCRALTAITIPKSVNTIGGSAFANCDKLANVTIEDGPSDLTFTTSNGGNYFNQSPIKTLHLGRNIVNSTSTTYIPFYGKTSLTTLTIGSNVNGISYNAFYGCSGLSTAVTIPSSVTSIGDNAFNGCVVLSAVTIGASVETIGDYAFNQCRALTAITIPKSVNSIGGNAFANCDKLANVTIEDGPSDLTFDGWGNYFNQSPVKTLHLGRNLKLYSGNSYIPFYGKTSLTTLTIGNNVKSINNNAFYGCSELSTAVTIPSSVTSIGDNAFNGCVVLSAVTIGANVETIGASAFNQCRALTKITIPKSVNTVSGSAFANCDNLANVTIEDGPSDLTFGGYGNYFNQSPIKTLYLGRNIVNSTSNAYIPFYGKTSLTTLTIGNNVKSIGKSTFNGCSGLNTAVTIPSSVTLIGDNAFDGCVVLSAVTIGANVETIGASAFNQCRALTVITIPKSVNTVGSSAFANCTNLANVTIEDGTSDLNFSGSNCFNQSPVKTLHLGRNLKLNSLLPFREKTSITTLTIGNNVSSIGNNVFNGCTGLSQITSNATTPPILQSNTFTNVSKNIPVYVPCDCLNAYKANQYWNTFTNINDDCTDIINVTTEKFQIFPNPVQSELFIKSEFQVRKVEIYSLTGILLLSENNFNKKIAVSKLHKGIYIVKIYTENSVIIEKIVKE